MRIHAADGRPVSQPDAVFGAGGRLQLGNRPARILILGAESAAYALRHRLEPLGALVFSLTRHTDIVAAVRTRSPDVILLDFTTPGLDGLAVIRALRDNPATHSIPIIVLSAPDDTAGRVEGLNEGAADCLARPLSHPELTARLRAVLRARSREELLRRRVSFLEELAASDPLTSLYNRRAFDDRLHLEMERAARGDQPLSCLLLDIDWFKTINDRFGHQVGDDVLRHIAKVMLDGRGERDAQCRYGGEEFAWLLPGADRARVLERAEWLRRMVEEAEIPTADRTFHVTISIGASTWRFREHGRIPAGVLLEQADSALLAAKKQGKNCVVFREPILEDVGAAGDPFDPAVRTEAAARIRPGSADGDPPTAGHPTASRALSDAWEEWGRDARLQEELGVLLRSSIKVLTEALAARDPETMTHCHRVASTAEALAMELDLPPQEIERIKLASLIHDIGKLAIPETILRKAEALTPAEWKLVRAHPERGAAMLQDAKAFTHLIDLVLYHQESFDGTGYPDGLRGSEIPLGARIIRVADVFDAMTSDRPYRPRKSLDDVRVELQRMAGGPLDPDVVGTLLRLLDTMSPVEREMIMRRDRDLVGEPAVPSEVASGAE